MLCHALGVIRMLVEGKLPVSLSSLISVAWPNGGRIEVKGVKPSEPVKGSSAEASVSTPLNPETQTLVKGFIYERLISYLKDMGYSGQEVEAVIALAPERLDQIKQQLDAVRAFAQLPEAPALAAANKRIGNILKKAEAEGPVDAHVSEVLLQEPAEKALYQAMQTTVPQANAQFDAGNYTASLQTLAQLRAPVDAFFDGVMVNAEQLDLRLNRLGLLKSLHLAMNRVADLSRLAA